MVRVLWLDDTIASYNNIVSLFKEEGLDVTPAPTIATAWAAYEAAEKRGEPFSVCLVDIALKEPEGQDGLEFISGLIASKFAGAIVVLSAHLHRKSYRDMVSSITHPVGVLEKSFQGGEEQMKSAIISKIKSWVDKPPTLEPKAYYESAEASESTDPILMSFARFDALPEYVQKEHWSKVKTRAQEAILEALEKGACWVLICGSAKHPTKIAYRVSEIPSEQQVTRIAREKGRAYYEFYRGHFRQLKQPALGEDEDVGHAFQVEETQWKGACAPHRKDYPTISIRFSNDSEVINSYHFDTGSGATFFSYEELVNDGVILPTRRRMPGMRVETNQEFEYVPEALSCLIVDQADTTKNTATSIDAIVIKDWLKASPFKVSCPQECSKGMQVGKAVWCRHRFGLVGRDILTGGEGVSLTLCGKSGLTRVAD